MTERSARPASSPGPLLYSVEEAAQLLGLGRTFTFQLVATGEIGSVKIGRCRKIPRDALDDYIERLRSEQEADADGNWRGPTARRAARVRLTNVD